MKKKYTLGLVLAVALAITPIQVGAVETEDLRMASTTVKNPFKDVSKNSSYYTIIHEMRDMGIINGYGDNTFKPSAEISRQNGVAMITRYTPVKYTGTKKFPTLTDVTTKNANYKGLVEFQKLEVFNVTSNGKVYPTKAMTRGEMAKAIAIAFDLKIDKNAFTKLKDVPASLKPYVAAIEKAGITTGYGDNTFQPNKTLTRSHFAVFMHRAIAYKKSVGGEGTPPNEDIKEPTLADLDKTKTLSDFSTTTLPKKPIDLGGIDVEAYEKKFAEDLLAVKMQVKPSGNSTTPIDFRSNDPWKYALDVLTLPTGIYKFSEAEAIQALNYIYYTGNYIVTDEYYIVFNHVTNKVMRGISQDV
ncbi:MAG: S-layer homology domain-containing protein [Lysinibacillus sp.]